MGSGPDGRVVGGVAGALVGCAPHVGWRRLVLQRRQPRLRQLVAAVEAAVGHVVGRYRRVLESTSERVERLVGTGTHGIWRVSGFTRCVKKQVNMGGFASGKEKANKKCI